MFSDSRGTLALTALARARVLDALRGRTALTIPQVEFVGKSCEFMGYRKIKGVALTETVIDGLDTAQRDRLVGDLARFLAEIHSAIGIDEALKLGVEREDLPSYASYVRQNLLGRALPPLIYEFAQTALAAYERILDEPVEEVLLYNDLHGDNMAFDAAEGRLNGIFDFGDVMIGDVNVDFYPLYKPDPSLMTAVAGRYSQLTGRSLSVRRMTLHAFLNELCDFGEFFDKPHSLVYRNALMRFEKWREDRGELR